MYDICRCQRIQKDVANLAETIDCGRSIAARTGSTMRSLSAISTPPAVQCSRPSTPAPSSSP